MKGFTVFAIASCLATFSVSATEQGDIELFKALAQCQASAGQVQDFNNRADTGQVSWAKDEQNSPWGGGAWQATPALSINGVSSATVVMTDRFSFFLQIASNSPQADAQKLATTLKLKQSLASDGYVDYQRRLDNGASLRVVSTENKGRDLYVGCSYPQTTF